MKPKVAYFTNIAPHYREKLWLNLISQTEVDFNFFFGEFKNKSIKPIDFDSPLWSDHVNKIHRLGNITFKKRLVYQTGVIKQILFNDWDIVIFLAQQNIISTWIACIIARIKGVPIIFWGHGIYGNENYLKRKIRAGFLSFANINLIYGNWAKNEMLKDNFSEESISVVYNSLDYDKSKELRDKVVEENYYKQFFDNDNKNLIFIGRFTKVKKLEILIKAVHELKKNNEHYNLMLVGDGIIKDSLIQLAKYLKIEAYFFGACYDEVKIAKLIANADLCVSPGNVGLTAIHAMSYGTPVCTNNDFKNQMPEFEAIVSPKTGCFFEKEKNNLGETITEWFKINIDREKIRKQCYKIVDSHYNPYNQTQIINEALESVYSKKI